MYSAHLRNASSASIADELERGGMYYDPENQQQSQKSLLGNGSSGGSSSGWLRSWPAFSSSIVDHLTSEERRVHAALLSAMPTHGIGYYSAVVCNVYRLCLYLHIYAHLSFPSFSFLNNTH